jgi:hypothetical protein
LWWAREVLVKKKMKGAKVQQVRRLISSTPRLFRAAAAAQVLARIMAKVNSGPVA